MKIRFGVFTLDLDTRLLTRNNREIHLAPKAFELLATLALDRPKVLSKAALQQRLWPDTFVAEANLSNLVAEIREALATEAEGQHGSEPRTDSATPSVGRPSHEPGRMKLPLTRPGPGSSGAGAAFLCPLANTLSDAIRMWRYGSTGRPYPAVMRSSSSPRMVLCSKISAARTALDAVASV